MEVWHGASSQYAKQCRGRRGNASSVAEQSGFTWRIIPIRNIVRPILAHVKLVPVGLSLVYSEAATVAGFGKALRDTSISNWGKAELVTRQEVACRQFRLNTLGSPSAPASRSNSTIS